MSKNILGNVIPDIVFKNLVNIARRYDMDLDSIIRERQFNHPNTLARFGRKCFSQTDEDGITIEILRRLGRETGTFAEFGVGDGTENNTLVLLALGWKGFWVGGENLAFDAEKSNRLFYQKEWVSRENIQALFDNGLKNFDGEPIDVLSLDLDGNDLYLCEELLANGVKPQLFIVEYNAKFPPPIRFSIDYDAGHEWQGDDYHGASLMSFCDLFGKHGYSLVCCNAATGANAFFVTKEELSKFPEVPERIDQIYTSPHFFAYKKYGHKLSMKTIEKIISD